MQLRPTAFSVRMHQGLSIQLASIYAVYREAGYFRSKRLWVQVNMK